MDQAVGRAVHGVGNSDVFLCRDQTVARCQGASIDGSCIDNAAVGTDRLHFLRTVADLAAVQSCSGDADLAFIVTGSNDVAGGERRVAVAHGVERTAATAVAQRHLAHHALIGLGGIPKGQRFVVLHL